MSGIRMYTIWTNIVCDIILAYYKKFPFQVRFEVLVLGSVHELKVQHQNPRRSEARCVETVTISQTTCKFDGVERDNCMRVKCPTNYILKKTHRMYNNSTATIVGDQRTQFDHTMILSSRAYIGNNWVGTWYCRFRRRLHWSPSSSERHAIRTRRRYARRMGL